MTTIDNSLVTAASIQMQAAIFSCKHSDFSGVLMGQYLSAPFEFNSLFQMIMKMEEVFDEKRFPEAYLTPRVFLASRAKTDYAEKGEVADMANIDELKPRLTGGTPKCTFEINVMFRQNATWQGQILWVEKNLKQSFRSVLEMLKLMDEAMGDNEMRQVLAKWGD